TVSGTSKGSWSIDAANTSPTGITINPSNVSDIWIVDSGTKKIYQYTAAASRTSGNQNAAASFALAANNTNPQGIADPPTGNMLLSPAPAPLPANLPVRATLSAVSFSSMPAVAAIPSLIGHDAMWAMLGGEILKRGNEPSLNLNANAGLASA